MYSLTLIISFYFYTRLTFTKFEVNQTRLLFYYYFIITFYLKELRQSRLRIKNILPLPNKWYTYKYSDIKIKSIHRTRDPTGILPS